MEVNQINNINLKSAIANKAVVILLEKNLITKEELKNVRLNYGYI